MFSDRSNRARQGREKEGKGMNSKEKIEKKKDRKKEQTCLCVREEDECFLIEQSAAKRRRSGEVTCGKLIRARGKITVQQERRKETAGKQPTRGWKRGRKEREVRWKNERTKEHPKDDRSKYRENSKN